MLAHEASHIRRFDPAVQLLSAIHRALLWFSPLSWFLHSRIVRVAEEASDDAAIAVTYDRVSYAEVLLDFMQRGVRTANWLGVPMARYGRPDDRIHRILDGTILSRGVTRWSVAAILAIGSPLAYVVAAAHPQNASQAKPMATPAAPIQSTEAPRSSLDSPQTPQPRQSAAKLQAASVELRGIGNVSPSATVVVKPRVDGQLMSVSFKEGELVQAGQVLASIDPQQYEFQLAQAQGPLMQDQAALDNARANLLRYQKLASQNELLEGQVAEQAAAIANLEARIKADQIEVDRAKLQLTYTRITAPITGVAGLRLVDPGNIVHAADALVVITQLQPIAVLFTIPEDRLPPVLAQLRIGASPRVEAWNRDNSKKLATGRLIAVDNQIDAETGTAKLKAEFDNKDSRALPQPVRKRALVPEFAITSSRLGERSVLAQQLIHHHASRRSDVQRMLCPQHRDAYVRIAARRYVRTYPIHLVPKHHAHRKPRRPIEQVHRMHRGLDRRESRTRARESHPAAAPAPTRIPTAPSHPRPARSS